MEEHGFDPNLREAMIRWLSQVYADLKQDFRRTVMSFEGDYWSSLQDGSLQKFGKRVMFNSRQLDEIIFGQNSFWPAIEERAQKSPILLRHSTEIIGSKFGLQRQYSLREVLQFILPVPKLLSENDIYLNLEEDPEEVVDHFLNDLRDLTITKTVIWPITGLATTEPLFLDGQFTFRELTIQEKLSCLNFGMIASRHDKLLSPDESRWFCLALETKEEKFVSDDDFDAEAAISNIGFRQDALEDFLVCASLIADTVISHIGGSSHAPSIELGNKYSGGTTGIGVHNGNILFRFPDLYHKIEGESRMRFLNVWTSIRGKDGQRGFHQIVNAARRLHYASTRHKAEDILVDLMIAAESLYLDGEANGELSYRLSLNAALWDSDDPGRRSKIFHLFRQAYSLRSKVVHGSKYSGAKVGESCNEVRPLIKRAINKAFDYINNGQQLPKWETLLFSEDWPLNGG